MYTFLFFLSLIVLIVIFYIFSRNKRNRPKDTSEETSPRNDGKQNRYYFEEQESTAFRQNASRNNYRSISNKLQKKYIFVAKDAEMQYTAALSVVALFSWVIRKDGYVGDQEMDVARIYFERHNRFNNILSNPPQDLQIDPITNAQCSFMRIPMRLLNDYNTLPKLLRYGLCCQNLLAAGIYYAAALDLLKALFQVAYSSDGVIDSEAEILRGIANELRIRAEDWNALRQRYGMNWGAKQKDKGGEDPSRKKTQEERWSDRSTGRNNGKKEYQNSQQEQPQKSSTFGYKLTQAYNKLGLLTTASESEIKEAYRTLVKKYHPDRLSPDATDMERKISADQFQLVKEAYDLIRLERGRG